MLLQGGVGKGSCPLSLLLLLSPKCASSGQSHCLDCKPGVCGGCSNRVCAHRKRVGRQMSRLGSAATGPPRILLGK